MSLFGQVIKSEFFITLKHWATNFVCGEKVYLSPFWKGDQISISYNNAMPLPLLTADRIYILCGEKLSQKNKLETFEDAL